MGAFNRVLSTQLVSSRLSTILSVPLPILISLAVFLTPWSYYVIGCFIYLLLDGIHTMILSFRHTLYNNAKATTTRRNFTVGMLVDVDKQFHPIHAVMCFLLGLFKATIASVQIWWLAPDVRHQIIFYGALVVSILTVLNEIMMLVIINKHWETKYLNNELGLKYGLAEQELPSCNMARHTFVVIDGESNYELLGVDVTNIDPY